MIEHKLKGDLTRSHKDRLVWILTFFSNGKEDKKTLKQYNDDKYAWSNLLDSKIKTIIREKCPKGYRHDSKPLPFIDEEKVRIELVFEKID